jgi:hypothetical protein
MAQQQMLARIRSTLMPPIPVVVGLKVWVADRKNNQEPFAVYEAIVLKQGNNSKNANDKVWKLQFDDLSLRSYRESQIHTYKSSAEKVASCNNRRKLPKKHASYNSSDTTTSGSELEDESDGVEMNEVKQQGVVTAMTEPLAEQKEEPLEAGAVSSLVGRQGDGQAPTKVSAGQRQGGMHAVGDTRYVVSDDGGDDDLAVFEVLLVSRKAKTKKWNVRYVCDPRDTYTFTEVELFCTHSEAEAVLLQIMHSNKL